MDGERRLCAHHPRDLHRIPAVEMLSGGESVMVEGDVEEATEKGEGGACRYR